MLLSSSFNSYASLEYSLNELEQQEQQWEQIQDPRVSSAEINLNSNKQILVYDNKQSAQTAMDALSNYITHQFKYLHAFTVENLPSNYIIPREGLLSVTDSTPVSKATVENQIILDDEVNGNSLYETAQQIGIDYLRDELNLTGNGIKIGILDSGVANNLTSFDDRVELRVVDGLNGTGYDGDGHGTHVTGIAVGNGEYLLDGSWQETDSPGMAPEATVTSIQVLNDLGVGENEWVLQGIEIAIDEGVDIISMSLSTSIYLGDNDPIGLAVKEAISQGIIVVAAAGNTGPIGSAVGIPGGLEDVITVGASLGTSAWTLSGVGPKTNEHPGPDILAPGVSVLSVEIGDVGPSRGQAATRSGTSMATPHVSGGIALLKEAFPTASLEQIREALLASAEWTSSDGLIDQVEVQGRGIVQFDKAYELLNQSIIHSTTSHYNMAVVPNLVQDFNYIYRHRIIGSTKSLPFFIHSSRNVTVTSNLVIGESGLDIQLPDQINLTSGFNRIDIELSLENAAYTFIEERLYFTDISNGNLLPYSNITFFLETRFPTGKILVDFSHDNDTKYAYFGNHGNDGQLSQMSRILEAEGYLIENSNNQTITSILLDSYDILIIANPDLAYSNNELQAIRDFAQNDVKAIFLMIGGGLLAAEEDPAYSRFNTDAISGLLEGTGISIDYRADSYATSACNFTQLVFYNERILSCLGNAQISNTQDIYLENYEFPHFGPELIVEDNTLGVVQTPLAYDGNDLVALALEFNSGGRMLVFSNVMPFDNEAVLYGYPGQSASVSRDLIETSIRWLSEPRSISMNFQINDNDINFAYTVEMHRTYKLSFKPQNSEGTYLFLGDTVQMYWRIDDLEAGQFSITSANATFDQSSETYTFLFNFDRYVIIDIFIPVENGDDIVSNGHITISTFLPNYDTQSELRNLGRVMFAAIFISWVLWLINEGGLKRKELIQTQKL